MQDLVRVDVPPLPSPLPARMSPQYRTSLAAVLLRPGPQQLSATSSWPWSPFYVLSSLPAQEGGEERGWNGDCAPATTACLEGTATRQALSPSVPCGLGVLLPQPSPSRAGAKRCLVPGWRQRVTSGAAGKRWTQPLQTSQAPEGWGRCQGRCLHQRVAGLWGNLEQRHPCTSPTGATTAVSATLQPKRWCLPHTLGCWSCLPCGMSPQKLGCSVVPVAVLRPSLAPQQLPSVQFHASCGGVGVSLGNHSNTGFHPPTKQEELTALAAQGHLCKYLSSLLYLGSVQKHDKAGKGTSHSHSEGRT